MNRKPLIVLVLLSITILTTGCTSISTNHKTNIGNNTDNTGESIGLANPASVYCEENGGTLELIFDNGESYGICHFKNGSTCEEREYYRKECFPIQENTGINKNMNGNTAKTGQKEQIDNKTQTGMTICTMDAKQCPDGSYVGRTGPDCKFKKCPTQSGSTNTITNILETHTNTSGYQEEGLTEDDIDLMEEIIKKLK